MFLLLFFIWAVLTALFIWVVLYRKRFFYDWYDFVYHKYRMRGDRWGEERSVRIPKPGHAAVHVVTEVNRDQTNLFVCGISAMESKDSGVDIPIEEVMALGNISLYDSHEPQSMYMLFENQASLWEHPFHGMGHREELKIGAKVYFVSMKDADEW